MGNARVLKPSDRLGRTLEPPVTFVQHTIQIEQYSVHLAASLLD